MKRIVLLGLLLVSYSLQAAVFNLHEGLTTSKSEMATVAKVAECVINDPGFQYEVGQIGKYDYTKDSVKQVEEKVRAAVKAGKPTATISTYYKKYSVWPKKTATLAYRNTGSNIIYFNTAKFPRSLEEMVNTAVHEWLHVVGYGHGTGKYANYAAGKEKSVNYWVGDLAQRYAKIHIKNGCK